MLKRGNQFQPAHGECRCQDEEFVSDGVQAAGVVDADVAEVAEGIAEHQRGLVGEPGQRAQRDTDGRHGQEHPMSGDQTTGRACGGGRQIQALLGCAHCTVGYNFSTSTRCLLASTMLNSDSISVFESR